MDSWYSEISAEEGLSQGDFILNCPIIFPPNNLNPEEWENINVGVKIFDVVIMSQSCDLENKKIDLVLVCPFFSLDTYIQANKQFQDYKLLESVRRGNLPSLHMLNDCPYISTNDILVVDFKSVFSVSFEFLNNFKKNMNGRVTLNSPYKEHLSQSFARFFMRVGLPSNIPPFKKAKKV